MSKTHTLLEDFGPAVIHTLLEGKKSKGGKGGKKGNNVNNVGGLLNTSSGSGSSGNPPGGSLLKTSSNSNLPMVNSYGGLVSSGGSSSKSPRGIGKYLLGLGALGAAGAGAYALRDKLGDADDDTGDAAEHINSLRDKITGLFAGHHDEA
jgi:hypothetical protein